MAQDLRQVRPKERVADEDEGDNRHGRTGGAAGRFQHNDHQRGAEDDVNRLKSPGAIHDARRIEKNPDANAR